MIIKSLFREGVLYTIKKHVHVYLILNVDTSFR